ncbi:Copper transport protein CCH [Glycine soja]
MGCAMRKMKECQQLFNQYNDDVQIDLYVGDRLCWLNTVLERRICFRSPVGVFTNFIMLDKDIEERKTLTEASSLVKASLNMPLVHNSSVRNNVWGASSMASDVGVEVISSSSKCLDEKEQVFENEHSEQYDTQGAEEGFRRSDMGCKLALEDKKRVAFRRRQRHEHVDASRHAKPCNCSSLASQQQKGHRTKEKLIQFLCSSCLLCARFVNSLAFAKSGEFLVAGVGHVKIFSNCVLLTVVLKVGMSCQGCAGAVNRILGKMEGIFIPASYLYYQIQNENDLVIVATFNSNILTPTINYGCHLHSSNTGITDIALLSSGIKSEKAYFGLIIQFYKEYTPNISGLCAMSRCFPFPPLGYTNKGYEKEGYNRGCGITDKGYENSNNVFPIYIGDDRTDEDAFRVTNAATPS